MAEAAEDILTGRCCFICGAMFVRAHGHPVSCRSCWAGLTENERGEYPRASAKEIGEGESNGVV